MTGTSAEILWIVLLSFIFLMSIKRTQLAQFVVMSECVET